jgi:GT2 family glycosyltransferase
VSELAVCVAVYKAHEAPNLVTLAAALPNALDGRDGELVVALNGITADEAGVPAGATVVSFDVNRGVPVAWNAAVRAASAPIACLLNDDVELGPGSLRLLHDAFSVEPDAGVVGPVGTLWNLAEPAHREWVDTAGAAPGTLHECDVVSGFCFATRTELFHELGGFDEHFTPCGFEEVDYCTAVRLNAGRKCFAVAGVPIEHEFGISAARPWHRLAFDGRRESIRSITRRNRAHFRRKWSATVSQASQPAS